MRTDAQEALSSLLEVAVFAWSLLELLLTRILPFAGFLTGHCLLYFSRLFGSLLVNTARGRRKFVSRQTITHVEDQLLERDIDALPAYVSDDQNKSERLDLPRAVDNLEEVQLIATQSEERVASPSLGASNDTQVLQAELPAAALTPDYQDLHKDNADLLDRTLAASSPAPDAAVKEVQGYGDNQWRRGESEGVLFEAAASQDVPLRGGINDQLARGSEKGPIGAAPSLHQAAENSTITASSGTEEADLQMRRSSRRIIRLLPPSLSQIKRTLMQKSRRAAASPPLPTGEPTRLGNALSPREQTQPSCQKAGFVRDERLFLLRKPFGKIQTPLLRA